MKLERKFRDNKAGHGASAKDILGSAHDVAEHRNYPRMKENTADRLKAAARAGLLSHGSAGCSARLIAELAGVNASAINYTFGGIKQLFAAVFWDALSENQIFLRLVEDELELWPNSPDNAAPFLEALIELWVAQPNGAALLYQQALASRHLAPEPLDHWLLLWADFFQRLAARHSLDPAQGRCMALMFQSEALFALSRWRPMLERAALHDLVGHFGAVWLGGAPHCPIGALAAAEAAVRRRPDADQEGPARTMMMAAVDVVADNGLTGLTHRAVATRCGVTAGAVAHYYRTAADLLGAAIRGQVVALMAQPGSIGRLSAVTSTADLVSVLSQGAVQGPGAATARGRRHLFLASLGDANHVDAGAVVRFAAGGTIREGVWRALPDDQATDLHASVLSRLLTAAVVVGGDDGAMMQALAADALNAFAAGVQTR
jgi:AcrR family transcriptional regulator